MRVLGTILFSLFLIAGQFLFCTVAIASIADGTIEAEGRHAWSENVGWIDFGTVNGAVHVTDEGLSGYALGENIGWIYLDAVVNDGEGNLSGYAWSENTGWINFNPANGGVSINSSGIFSGSALSENVGWIMFDTDTPVTTDWRPASSRSTDGTVTTTSSEGTSSSGGRRRSSSNSASVNSLVANVSTTLHSLLSRVNIFTPTEPLVYDSETYRILPQVTDESETTEKTANVSSPTLPERLLRIPSIASELAKRGIENVEDLVSFGPVKTTVPTWSEVTAPSAGNRTLEEVHLIKTDQGGVNLPVSLTIQTDGSTAESVTLVAGKSITVGVKPEASVKLIRGYLVLASDSKIAKSQSQLASVQSAFEHFLPKGGEKELATLAAKDLGSELEERLVLARYTYSDSDRDGIYTTTVTAPSVAGTYELITIIDYESITLPRKELRLATVIDPEGYVYEAIRGQELRIAGAIVTLYSQNLTTQKFERWPAQQWEQKNPQTTDKRGSYAFLVPPGRYYLTVESAAYTLYKTKEFTVSIGANVHQSIRLTRPNLFIRSWWWIKGLLD